MSAQEFLATALSRTGSRFHALCALDEEGLSVVTRGAHGFASAHRAIARTYYGRPIDLMLRTEFMSTASEELVVTVWQPRG